MYNKLLILFICFFHFTNASLVNNDNNNKPTEYEIDSPIPLKVNKLTSTKTGVPYSYYSLPFCSPKERNFKKENLAETLGGNHFEDSLYEINALVPIECRVINYLPSVNDSTSCTFYDSSHLDQFIEKVKQDYMVHWTLDGLPAAVPNLVVRDRNRVVTKQYKPGYPLGIIDKIGDGIWINNHVDINIVYGEGSTPGNIVILGFEVSPRSQWYDPTSWQMAGGEEGTPITTCPNSALMPYDQQSIRPINNNINNGGDEVDVNINVNGGGVEKRRRVYWTYSVHWEKSETIKWEKRWDLYLASRSESQIHLVSILNALIIVLFLVVVSASVVKRTFSGNGDIRTDDFESRWRAGGTAVFRVPKFPLPLSVLIGTGAQVFGMAITVMVFGILGLLSPAHQGAYLTPLSVIFILTGALSGFFSTYCYKLLRGTHRSRIFLSTTFFFPSLSFTLFFICNLCLRDVESSAALSFSNFAKVVVIWYLVSIPLVLIGSVVGHVIGTRVHPSSPPSSSSSLNHHGSIHKQMWYQRPLFAILFAGVLPFGVVVIEFFFVVEAFWGWPIYNAYRYLGVSLLTLLVTCGCTNVVICFFQLSSGYYDWWWRPYLHGAASALYMFIYIFVIFFTTFHLQQTQSIIIYFIFAFFSSCLFFLLTGTTGFAACYIFLHFIYKNHSPSSHYHNLLPLHCINNNNNNNN